MFQARPIKFFKQQWSIIAIAAVAIIFFTIVVIVIVHKSGKNNTEDGYALDML